MFQELRNRLKESIPTDIQERVWSWITVARTVSGAYVLWILAHYVSSHLYVSWCVPRTVIGFVISPFLIPAPHCQALRWAIYNGGTNVMTMWGALSLWVLNKVVPSE